MRVTRKEEEMNKKVYKYGTGDIVPEEAKYLWSCKNGVMDKDAEYQFVWHYYEVLEEASE